MFLSPFAAATAVVCFKHFLVRILIGVPGDICQQFTREMFDMYQGFAAYKNWDFEVVNYTNAEYGKLGFCLLIV